MSRLAEELHGHFVLEAIGPIGCGHSKDEPEIHVAEFIREQLLSDEAVERVALALNGAGWVCMGCEYEPYDFDKCQTCREVCTKQALTALNTLLGDTL